MPGQPQIAGWLEFDVTNLEVREPMTPPPAGAQNIIDWGEPFDLVVTFTGAGDDWRNMKRAEEPFQAFFYAEGLGAAAPEIDFGRTDGNLEPGQDIYTATLRVTGGIQARGIFKCAAVVEFPGRIGVLGYYDTLLIQVSSREEYG